MFERDWRKIGVGAWRSSEVGAQCVGRGQDSEEMEIGPRNEESINFCDELENKEGRE